MWVSGQNGRRREAEPPAETGVVTIEGARPGVYLGDERREVPVFGPGGYCWRPAQGQQVLVLKAGGRGEEPCVAGARQETVGDLAPGEVCIRAGGAEIRLRPDGVVDLTGEVRWNGVPLDRLFQPREPEEGGNGT